MKRMIALAVILAFGLMAGLTVPALAQRKHAPKAVWQGMLANLSDVQGIVAALTVFDMKRIEQIAGVLSKREGFISKIPRLSDAAKKTHADISVLSGEIGTAAKAGDEKVIIAKLGAILNKCSGCHYNARDAKRRKGQ